MANTIKLSTHGNNKLTEDKLNKLKTLICNGVTIRDTAKYLKVDKSTITNWINGNPELFIQYQQWKAIATGEVERTLYKRAVGYTTSEEKAFLNIKDGTVVKTRVEKEIQPSDRAIEMYLKAHRPDLYTDKVINVNLETDIQSLSIEQKREQLQALLDGRQPIIVDDKEVVDQEEE